VQGHVRWQDGVSGENMKLSGENMKLSRENMKLFRNKYAIYFG
jgi:hypothetical protein